jgi:hypothetical protein
MFYRLECNLDFDHLPEVHDEIEVLKRMDMAFGLDKGSCSADALNMARNMIPPPCIPHLEGTVHMGKVSLAAFAVRTPTARHCCIT